MKLSLGSINVEGTPQECIIFLKLLVPVRVLRQWEAAEDEEEDD